MAVDAVLIDAACTALGVSNPDPLQVGGQKSVFRAQRGAEEVVLKVMAVDSLKPDAIRRAEREVTLLKDIDHPNLVRVLSDLVSIARPPGVAWLEELLDGDDLTNSLGTQWTWDDAAQLGIHLGRGLETMHERRVVHRDLSPGNVRMRADGTAVVIDPGYARHELRSDLTFGGQPGTPGYASPEHLEAYSGVPTAFSDVFCIGILLFEALCGAVPIAYLGDAADYVRRLGACQRTQVADFRTDLKPQQVEVIDRCLHKQPARRYLSGAAVADALEAVR